ncbi:hypothetical protein BDA99DRAFT_518403 [Phascolomyces articulosus]|uniref:Late embryogenesis abundant protein LEA-2 subgroup domain-containing protein n=1 Tax=Phascolomyces articulosus TaxID=60185 RepID=A0AAD5PB75_9FUNG|nr:hypothetical protein BDA99DRAFT_518403 [Phascolomyces articulosus]
MKEYQTTPPPPPLEHQYHHYQQQNSQQSFYHEKTEQQQQQQEREQLPPPPPLSEEETVTPRKRHWTERNRCCRCLCCSCCLPIWARYILWFIIIAIIICVVVIGGLAGSFKMPTVNVLDVTAYPGDNTSQITFDGQKFMFNLGLIVNVDNPNVLPIFLSDMNAKANIPVEDGTSAYLGHGYLDKEKIPTNSNYNFTYPFSIEYDTQSTQSQVMLNTLMTKCGLMGGEAQDITVDYSINVNARVLFVKLNLDLGGSATFGCPLTNGGLPGLGGMSLDGAF